MLLLPMMLASCSGNTNSTGPASPLPTGQNGSLKLWTGTNAGCYVLDDGAPCSTSPPSGTNPITAVSTLTSASPTTGSSTNYLLVGDSVGKLTAWSVPNSSALPSVICTATASAKIQGVAAQYGSSSTVYVVSGGTLEYDTLTSSGCSSTTTTTVGTTGSVVGLALAHGYVYGISSTGKYFSILAGSTSPSSISTPSTLPNLPSTATIGGMTADPNNNIVFVTDYTNSAIYAYYAHSNGTLSSINGNFSGNVDITNPKAITTVYAPIGTTNGCPNGSSGPCEFLYVTNYSSAVVQLVPSVSGSGTSTSIGYNEFNAPYTDCEIINPLAMTSFSNVNATPTLAAPWVFIGQNGTSAGPCQALPSGTTYGNGVTAYNLSPTP
jgi:hypothetical protein